MQLFTENKSLIDSFLSYGLLYYDNLDIQDAGLFIAEHGMYSIKQNRISVGKVNFEKKKSIYAYCKN